MPTLFKLKPRTMFFAVRLAYLLVPLLVAVLALLIASVGKL